jgi:hypothetical protein
MIEKRKFVSLLFRGISSNGSLIVIMTLTSHTVAQMATRRVAKPLMRSSPTMVSLKPIIVPTNTSGLIRQKICDKRTLDDFNKFVRRKKYHQGISDKYKTQSTANYMMVV